MNKLEHDITNEQALYLDRDAMNAESRIQFGSTFHFQMERNERETNSSLDRYWDDFRLDILFSQDSCLCYYRPHASIDLKQFLRFCDIGFVLKYLLAVHRADFPTCLRSFRWLLVSSRPLSRYRHGISLLYILVRYLSLHELRQP